MSEMKNTFGGIKNRSNSVAKKKKKRKKKLKDIPLLPTIKHRGEKKRLKKKRGNILSLSCKTTSRSLMPGSHPRHMEVPGPGNQTVPQ